MSHYYFLKCLDCNPRPDNFWEYVTDRVNGGAELYRTVAAQRLKLLQAQSLLDEAGRGLQWSRFLVAYEYTDPNWSDVMDFLRIHATHKIALCGEYSTDPVIIVDPEP